MAVRIIGTKASRQAEREALATPREMGECDDLGELLGYKVERIRFTKRDGSLAPVYLLTGKRGAQYGLVRNLKHPEMLFPMNLRSRCGGIVTVKGYSWFTDAGGELAPLR
jgi:hypothetical protein